MLEPPSIWIPLLVVPQPRVLCSLWTSVYIVCVCVCVVLFSFLRISGRCIRLVLFGVLYLAFGYDIVILLKLDAFRHLVYGD